MKTPTLFFLSASLFICSFTLVDSKVPQEQDPINPNGSSELALMMRAMFDEGVKMKEALLRDEKVVLEIDYSKLLTSKATEPEKAASPTYKAFSQAFINIMDSYQKCDLQESKAIYLDMVKMCQSCHQSLCPGPLVRIDLLELNRE